MPVLDATDLANLAAAVWAYATRTLTSTAAATTAAVSGSNLYITRGVTFTATISGLTIPATWSKVYLTVKLNPQDTDAQSILQIVESNPGAGTDGLLYLEGAAIAAPTVVGDAALAVTQAAGTIGITIDDEATVLLTARSQLDYDVKCLLADGTSQILTAAQMTVGTTPTLTV